MRIKADQKVSLDAQYSSLPAHPMPQGLAGVPIRRGYSIIRTRYISALAKSHRSSYRQGGRCEGSDQDRGDPPFSLQGRIPSSMRTLHLGTSFLGDEKGAIDAATRKVAGRVIHDTIPPAVHAGLRFCSPQTFRQRRGRAGNIRSPRDRIVHRMRGRRYGSGRGHRGHRLGRPVLRPGHAPLRHQPGEPRPET